MTLADGNVTVFDLNKTGLSTPTDFMYAPNNFIYLGSWWSNTPNGMIKVYTCYNIIKA